MQVMHKEKNLSLNRIKRQSTIAFKIAAHMKLNAYDSL